jgi:addiction module HigA family antidote
VKARVQSVINLILQYPHAGQQAGRPSHFGLSLSVPDFLQNDRRRACHSRRPSCGAPSVLNAELTMTTYGYARISTDGQRDAAQVEGARYRPTVDGGLTHEDEEPPHPGEIVANNLAALGVTVKETAEALGVTRQLLDKVISGRNGITPEMAVRLEKGYRRRRRHVVAYADAL